MSASHARCDISILTVHLVQVHLTHVVKQETPTSDDDSEPPSWAKTNLKILYRVNVFDEKEMAIASKHVTSILFTMLRVKRGFFARAISSTSV